VKSSHKVIRTVSVTHRWEALPGRRLHAVAASSSPSLVLIASVVEMTNWNLAWPAATQHVRSGLGLSLTSLRVCPPNTLTLAPGRSNTARRSWMTVPAAIRIPCCCCCCELADVRRSATGVACINWPSADLTLAAHRRVHSVGATCKSEIRRYELVARALACYEQNMWAERERWKFPLIAHIFSNLAHRSAPAHTTFRSSAPAPRALHHIWSSK